MREQRIPSATPDRRPMTKVPGNPGLFRKGNRVYDTWKEHGKQRKRSYRTLTEAKRGRAERIASDSLPASRERFDRYAERWLVDYRGRKADGISEDTRTAYALLLRTYAIPYFRHRPIGDLRPLDIKTFIDHLATLAPRRPQRGATTLSPATVRRIMVPLKAMLTEAWELGLVPINASAVRIVVPGAPKGASRPKTMTAEQIATVIGLLREDDRLLFTTMARTGVRISEALSPCWRDFTSTDAGPVLVVRKSKTDAGVRSIAVVPSLARALTLWRAATKYPGPDDPIFPSLVGGHRDAHNVRRNLRPATKAAGVPWATPHVFRHSLATEMRDAGYDMSVIAKVLGHSDPTFTRRVYVHTQDAPRFDDLDRPASGTVK
jgi:integrase